MTITVPAATGAAAVLAPPCAPFGGALVFDRRLQQGRP